MTYQKTEEALNDKLLKEGFIPYPSMPNKYWNADGRVIWTDGSFYQERVDRDWEKYNEEVFE